MKKLTLALLLLISLMLVVGTSSVLAEGPDSPPNEDELTEDPPGDGLPGPDEIPEDENIQQDGHYICEHKTDQPHKSGHPNTVGRINVEGWIDCDTQMKRLEITTYLQKKSWCVWFYCHWSNVGDNPKSEWQTKRSWAYYVESNRSMPCQDGIYRGKSFAYTKAPNDEVRRGWHYSAQRTLNC